MEFIEVEYLSDKKVTKLEKKYGQGIPPTEVFTGGASFYDDGVMWFVFDNEPTLTFHEVKDLAEGYDLVPNDDCNPEDYKTWEFWRD